jgi:hypothetical protein
MEEIANVDLWSEMYTCLDDGSIDWEAESTYEGVTFKVPDAVQIPDIISGTLLYEEKTLKIIAKNPVAETFEDGSKTTYVYMLFCNTGESDLQIRLDTEKEITVEGGTGSVYFQEPNDLIMGDTMINCLQIEQMQGDAVIIPLCVVDVDGPGGIWNFELRVPII